MIATRFSENQILTIIWNDLVQQSAMEYIVFKTIFIMYFMHFC